MLTKRQNLLETIRGGRPDRFVNQYEAFALIRTNPVAAASNRPTPGGGPVVDAWGVTKNWPEGLPGPFPVHDEAHILCKDVTRWREAVKAPPVVYPASAWEPMIAMAEQVDRSEQFVMPFVAPGVFEQCHYLLEIKNCLIDLLEEPEAMHELIEYITEFELTYAEQLCKYLKPDGVFHHDDWGSQLSTFISPDMFAEFFVPAYQQIYGYYKSHGAKLIVHHSDSYAATLVPAMIEIGIDIWQGVMTTNDVKKLVQAYGGKISFMGGINSATVDHPGWTREEIRTEVRRACGEYGNLYYIPNTTMGGPESVFPGVYDTVSEEIAAYNREVFPVAANTEGVLCSQKSKT